jgi:hypothetical protein
MKEKTDFNFETKVFRMIILYTLLYIHAPFSLWQFAQNTLRWAPSSFWFRVLCWYLFALSGVCFNTKWCSAELSVLLSIRPLLLFDATFAECMGHASVEMYSKARAQPWWLKSGRSAYSLMKIQKQCEDGKQRRIQSKVEQGRWYIEQFWIIIFHHCFRDNFDCYRRLHAILFWGKMNQITYLKHYHEYLGADRGWILCL